MSRTRTLLALAIVVVAAPLVACAPTPTAPGGGGAIAAGCYDSTDANAPDLLFNGIVNVPNNLDVVWSIAVGGTSTNGTCTGAVLGAPYAFTLVRSADQTAATSACSGLGLTDGVSQLNTSYPTFPADAWICNPPADA